MFDPIADPDRFETDSAKIRAYWLATFDFDSTGLSLTEASRRLGLLLMSGELKVRMAPPATLPLATPKNEAPPQEEQPEY